MTNAELGRIIKEARIARRMTQSEVVGDFIIRPSSALVITFTSGYYWVNCIYILYDDIIITN